MDVISGLSHKAKRQRPRKLCQWPLFCEAYKRCVCSCLFSASFFPLHAMGGRRKSARTGNASTAAAPNPALQSLLNTIRDAEEEARTAPQLNLSTLGKRTRGDGDGNSDDDEAQDSIEDGAADNGLTTANASEPATTINATANQNITTYARNYAARHNLPLAQVKEVEEFSCVRVFSLYLSK